VQKDLTRRLHDIADARIEIEDTLREPRETSEVAAPVPAGRLKWIMAAAVAGTGLLGFILGGILSDMARGRGAPEAIAPPTARFVVDLPETLPLEPSLRSALAVSPDGQRVVYVARSGDSTELALRRMDNMEVHPIPGTKGASGPFFSPDGEYIGFQVAGKLMKAPLSGGAVPLADASAFRGGAWNSRGTILFTAVPGTGLWRVPAMGGDSQLVTELDLDNDERTHRWPNFLPGGMHALITVRSGWHSSFEQGQIARLSLSSGTIESVFDGGSDAQYVPSGHLLFVRSGKLFAVPYDPDENRIAGQATAVVDEVMTNPSTGAGHFDVSTNGTLAYVRGGEWVSQRQLVWVAPDETERPVIASTGAFQSPRLSPDGKRLAVTVEGANDDIWIYDQASGSPMRLTFEAGANVAPTWSPDSSQVTFSSNRKGSFNLYRKPADGSRPAERLTTSEHIQFVGSWSSDGLLLAFIQISAETGPDIWVYDDETKQQEPLLQGVYSESSPAFSPDGRWLAYTSDESGRPEIYAHEFRGSGGKWQVSTEGGSEPLWSQDGRTLFYRSGNRLIRVPVQPGAEWVAQKPQVALEVKYEANAISGIPNYDVSPNGKEFVMVRSQPRMLPGQIQVVLNWFEELRRAVPTVEQR
jgi:serine/threonine-protein kinase